MARPCQTARVCPTYKTYKTYNTYWKSDPSQSLILCGVQRLAEDKIPLVRDKIPLVEDKIPLVPLKGLTVCNLWLDIYPYVVNLIARDPAGFLVVVKVSFDFFRCPLPLF